MKPLENATDKAGDEHKPVAKDNPPTFQEKRPKQIIGSPDQRPGSLGALIEAMLLAIYGLPALQAANDIDPQSRDQVRLNGNEAPSADGGPNRRIEVQDRRGRAQGKP
jgi:hypothetical protein